MSQYLKCYQVVMRTVAPVFIGSGKEIGKKEYVHLNQNEIGIPDIMRFYDALRKMGKSDDFEQYLLENRNMDLSLWLRKQGIRMEQIKPYIRYKLDCGDAIIEKGSNRLQVMECVKDAYGNPYVPGSSLKGMFRTILLGADIQNNPQKYQQIKQMIQKNAELSLNKNQYLVKEMDELENIAFHTLNREGTKIKDAVNDSLQGFIISDSEPLTVEDLVLCQKIDVNTKGIEKRLPMLRECVKPNTEIRFTITVDIKVCGLTKEDIMDAVELFMEQCDKNFLSAFSDVCSPKKNEVFLGGGCGFVSKTVLYSLFGKKDGLELVPKVFEKTRVPREHKHYLDKEYGASPHTRKCTRYQGKLYQMGLCRIEQIEEI